MSNTPIQASRNGVNFPVAYTATLVNTQSPPIIANANLQQVLGTASESVSFSIPALIAGQETSLTQNVSLTTFPSPFSISSGSKGIVTASMFLDAPPANNVLAGCPSMTLSFGTGIGIVSAWTIVSGPTYRGAAISLTMSFRAGAGASAAQTVTGTVQAVLLGIPAGGPTNALPSV